MDMHVADRKGSAKVKETVIRKVSRYIVFHLINTLSLFTNVFENSCSKPTTNVKDVLVIDIAMLGDLLMTTPLLAGIKHCFPGSSTTVICTPWAVEALRDSVRVDRIHMFEPFWEDRSTEGRLRFKHVRSFIDLIHFFRRNRFDVAFVLSLREQPIISLLGFMSGAPVRVGVKYPLGYRFLTHAVTDSGEHAVLTKLKILTAVTKQTIDGLGMEYRVSEESGKFAQEYIDMNFGEIPFVCVTPSTLQTAKQWSEASWVELINKLTDDGIGVILGGSRGDRDYIMKIHAQIKNLDLCKQTAGSVTLNQFAALMKLSSGLLTVESAPMHLASCLGTPCVVLFSGVYDFKRFGPLNCRSTILNKNVECARCQKGCSYPKCMDFSVREVYHATSMLLSHRDMTNREPVRRRLLTMGESVQ